MIATVPDGRTSLIISGSDTSTRNDISGTKADAALIGAFRISISGAAVG